MELNRAPIEPIIDLIYDIAKNRKLIFGWIPCGLVIRLLFPFSRAQLLPEGAGGGDG